MLGRLNGEDAGVQLQHGGAVIDAVADHGANHAEVVDAGGHVRKQIADGDTALPVLLEGPLRLQQAADGVFAEGQSALERNGLAVVLLEAGLGSNVSMLDGPPCMNRKMMRLALGAKCGCLGASRLRE